MLAIRCLKRVDVERYVGLGLLEERHIFALKGYIASFSYRNPKLNLAVGEGKLGWINVHGVGRSALIAKNLSHLGKSKLPCGIRS